MQSIAQIIFIFVFNWLKILYSAAAYQTQPIVKIIVDL